MYKGRGVCFADFISFFLNTRRNNLVSLKISKSSHKNSEDADQLWS